MGEPKAKETFGERFTRLIRESGLDTQEVNRIVGWKSDSSFYKAKRGDQSSIKAMGLLRLAARLRVSPYYLMGEPEPSLTEPKQPEFAETLQVAPEFERLTLELKELNDRLAPVFDLLPRLEAILPATADAGKPRGKRSRPIGKRSS